MLRKVGHEANCTIKKGDGNVMINDDDSNDNDKGGAGWGCSTIRGSKCEV